MNIYQYLMMNKKKMFVPIIALLLIYCNQNNLSDNDIILLKNTITNALNIDCCRIQELKKCFIVDPYLNDLNKEEWQQIKLFFNNHGYKKISYPHTIFHKQLIKWSNCTQSEVILQVIYFDNNFIVLKLVENLDTYTLNDLIRKKKKSPNEIYYLYFKRKGGNLELIDIDISIYD